jgi:hypothetical protein
LLLEMQGATLSFRTDEAGIWFAAVGFPAQK